MILNHKLVGAGSAWHYVKYAPEKKTLANSETDARKAKGELVVAPEADTSVGVATGVNIPWRFMGQPSISGRVHRWPKRAPSPKCR